ncbi:unnamed protein product [Caenorhabditis nigoni]
MSVDQLEGRRSSLWVVPVEPLDWTVSDGCALGHLSSRDCSQIPKNNDFQVVRLLMLSPTPHKKISGIGDSIRSQIATKSVVGKRRRQLFEASQDERNWES